MIRTELRDLAERFIPAEDLAWFKASFPNVWVKAMEQHELLK